MPEIKINIVDNTSAVLGSTDVYTVFIPGNSKYVNNKTLDNSDYFGKYNLFTSLTDFNKVIKDPDYDNSDYPYTKEGTPKWADPGFELAKLALANNLPVLYYIPELKFHPAEYSNSFAIASGTTYCTRSGAGTEQEPYVYTVVETFEKGNGYYIRTGEEGSYEYTFAFTIEDVTYYTRSGSGTKQEPYVYTETSTFTVGNTYYVKTIDEYYDRLPYDEVKALVNSATPNIFEDLKDKSLFDIRFVTNGGYDWCAFDSTATTKINAPESIQNAMAVANHRGDCIALIDFAKSIKAKDLLTADLTSIGATNTPANYAAFVPWVTYNEVCLPASAGYLEAFGKQTVNNPNWFATAGFVRGIVSGTPNEVIGEIIADKLVKDNSIAINPITRVSTSATNFYNMIWGNRTTYTNAKGLKASSFLNIIQLCCDLSKRLYRASKENMYEQNTDRLWFNFKAPVEEMLNNMLQNEGIEGYKIIRQNATQRAQVRALVKIVPVEAVEKFDITIELADNLEVSVTIAE